MFVAFDGPCATVLETCLLFGARVVMWLSLVSKISENILRVVPYGRQSTKDEFDFFLFAPFLDDVDPLGVHGGSLLS